MEQNQEQEIIETSLSWRKEKRTDEEYTSLIHRLNRIEGQIRGVKRMLERDSPYSDIIIQTSAIHAALDSFCSEILMFQAKNCVVPELREGKDDSLTSFLATIKNMMK